LVFWRREFLKNQFRVSVIPRFRVKHLLGRATPLESVAEWEQTWKGDRKFAGDRDLSGDRAHGRSFGGV
jgi:hypothetical protein